MTLPTCRSCRTCVYLRRKTESWELPNIVWYECAKVPQNSTLRQFPFKNTTCPHHTPTARDAGTEDDHGK